MLGQNKTMRGLLPSAKKMISFNGRQSSSFEKGNITIVISIVAVLIISYIIYIPIILGVVGGLLLLLIVYLFATRRSLKYPLFGGHKEGHDKCEESGIRDDQPVALSGKPACRSEQPTSEGQNLGTIPSLSTDCRVFEMEELVAATENFHDNNKLGEGGFGAVYKGTTSQGTEIAVKKLFKNSKQGQKEFQNEVMLIAKVQHRNLVKLLGCCVEGSEKLIVYEYLPNNCLHKFLFDPNGRRHLDWQKRYSVILGITRGLLYLHEDSHLRIIHRDIKASNILLDMKFSPKIADFGIARLLIDDESHVRTNPAGSRGYMAPEYVMEGQLSVKADVYSFGILLLEFISGRKNLDFNLEEEKQILLLWVRELHKGGNLVTMIDPVIIETCSDNEEVLRCIHVALLCTQVKPSLRPSISRITLMLSKPDCVFSIPIHGTQSTTISRNQNDPPATKSSSLSSASAHTHISGPSRTSPNAVASAPSMVQSTRGPEKLKFWKAKFWRAMFWNSRREKTQYSVHGELDDQASFTCDENIVFTLKTLQTATENFNYNNKLGEGGFGPVYKGTTPDGKQIAVKKLSLKSMQGRKEFLNEIRLVAKIRHRNLVKLLGCCAEGSERLLVYEYLANKSLDQILFDLYERRKWLDWQKRYNIIVGVARGLLYLHQDSQLLIIHRDIKASNILLDDKLNPKISDFGLARLFSEEETHVSTRVAGTWGYMAPEYAMQGHLSVKVDVYSFGVLLLELVAGRKNTDFNLPPETERLLVWAWSLYEGGNRKQLIDGAIIETCDEEEALRCIHVALLCTQAEPSLRPPMSRVTMMLSADPMTKLPDPSKLPFAQSFVIENTKSNISSGLSIPSGLPMASISPASITEMVLR